MVRSLRTKKGLYELGDRRTIRAGQLSDEVLRAGNDITVFREKVPSDKQFWWGHGGESRTSGNTVHTKGDVVRAADGASIDGEVVLAITDSDGDPLAKRTYADLESLREAINESRSERPMMAAMGPAAGSDRYIELRINADAANDSDTVDSAASTLKLFYTAF